MRAGLLNERFQSGPAAWMGRPWTTMAVALVAFIGLTMGCGNSGRDLPEPVPGAVSPTRSTEAAGVPIPSTGPFTLSSSAFTTGGSIPAQYSCDGPSPDLTWSGALPTGTIELALSVVDTDAGNFVHWFVAGINASDAAVKSGATPLNVAQLTNSAGKAGYSGPCPPAGKTHTYEFTIYALSAAAALPANSTGKDALSSIQDKVLGKAVLVGTFGGATAGTSAAAPTTVP